MDFNILKKISLLSVICGAGLGIITLIPYLNLLSFLFLTFLVAPLVVVYAKYNGIFADMETKDASIWSAIIGFVAFSGFFVIFVPLSAFIGIFYKSGVYLVMKLLFSSGGGLFILFLAFFMIGLLIALFNAFSGALATYLYQQVMNKK